VTVDDEAVAEAIRIYWSDTHNLAEGVGPRRSPLARAASGRDKLNGLDSIAA
jgi:threonine dehydratase